MFGNRYSLIEALPTIPIVNKFRALVHTGQPNFAKKAKAGAKGAAQAVQKKELEVETDPEKLLSHCCGVNYLKDSQDPELKADSEYPDWLWNLRLEREPIPIEQLDQDSIYYWRRLRRMNLRLNARLRGFKLH